MSVITSLFHTNYQSDELNQNLDGDTEIITDTNNAPTVSSISEDPDVSFINSTFQVYYESDESNENLDGISEIITDTTNTTTILSIPQDPELSFINPTFQVYESEELDKTLDGVSETNSNTSDTKKQVKPNKFSLEAIVEKLARNAEQQCHKNNDQKYEKVFLDKILEKLEQDVKNKCHKDKTVEFLFETFCDMILLNDDFVSWLSKKLDYDRPMRLFDIIKKYTSEFKKWQPRNSLPQSMHHEIYAYWLKPEVSITTVDRRNGRDEVKIAKIMYQRDFRHLQGIPDENIKAKEIVLKKTGNKMEIMTAQKKIFNEPIRQLHQKFVATSGQDCSLSTFYKYKPFYVTLPTEREKETCLCMKCTNIHFLLDAINRYRKNSKLKVYESATQYLADFKEGCENHKQFPEGRESKKTHKYGYFANKKESYLRDGKNITYTRTARRDTTEPVCQIVKLMVETGPAYLKHRSYVDNISAVLPLMETSFTGHYIELDFSENIAITPKHEIQEAHFSGKQYTLHCTIVKPGEKKYVYHLSGDTKHDAIFVQNVLTDIFDNWNIKNEIVVVKSDNAPTQYKNKYAFASMQSLADKYNVTVVRLFGAPGHGKGLIDAMSSFGVKSVLRRDIVTKNDWFNNSQEIVDHLEFRGDPHMYYKVIQPEILDKARQNPNEMKIEPCMKMHLFVFKPGNTNVYTKEYLCDCSSCVSFNFDECERQEVHNDTEKEKETYDYNGDCELDEQLKSDHVFEFVEKGTFVAMASDDFRELLYFAKIIEKNIAKDDETLHDRFGHTIFPGQQYLSANYLKLTRSKKASFKQYSILNAPLYIQPDEVFEPYVEIKPDMSLDMDTYSSLIRKIMNMASEMIKRKHDELGEVRKEIERIKGNNKAELIRDRNQIARIKENNKTKLIKDRNQIKLLRRKMKKTLRMEKQRQLFIQRYKGDTIVKSLPSSSSPEPLSQHGSPPFTKSQPPLSLVKHPQPNPSSSTIAKPPFEILKPSIVSSDKSQPPLSLIKRPRSSSSTTSSPTSKPRSQHSSSALAVFKPILSSPPVLSPKKQRLSISPSSSPSSSSQASSVQSIETNTNDGYKNTPATELPQKVVKIDDDSLKLTLQIIIARLDVLEKKIGAPTATPISTQDSKKVTILSTFRTLENVWMPQLLNKFEELQQSINELEKNK